MTLSSISRICQGIFHSLSTTAQSGVTAPVPKALPTWPTSSATAPPRISIADSHPKANRIETWVDKQTHKIAPMQLPADPRKFEPYFDTERARSGEPDPELERG